MNKTYSLCKSILIFRYHFRFIFVIINVVPIAILLMACVVSELESNAFRRVKGAENVQGVVSAELIVKSVIKCSARYVHR